MLIIIFVIICKPLNLQRPFQEVEVRDSDLGKVPGLKCHLPQIGVLLIQPKTVSLSR